jgi:O6-methylguanine-DNA--protein-cysteine methyltransferase
VIPKTGDVGGYRWGIEQKTTLLSVEKKAFIIITVT